MKRRIAMSVFIMVAILSLPLSVLAAPTAQSREPVARAQFFAPTGKTARGVFLEYWERNGGLARQGYPISSELMERSDTNGRMYAVQYFERAVFEHHPGERPITRVQLQLLGTFLYERKHPGGAPNQRVNQSSGARLFPVTGKTVGGPFLGYWQRNGGLPQLGYPISEEFQEKSDLDGNIYKVQYFERAVMELHPELEMTNRVLLSQLGTFRLRGKYTGGQPPVGQFTPEEVDYFAEVALGTEFGDSQPVVSRWVRPLRIKVNGTATPQDRETLGTVSREINELLGEEKLVLVDAEPNLNIYFMPSSRFSEFDPDYVPGNEGFASVFWDADHRIYRGIVLISSDRVTQRERSHLIREELTQALGLLRDSFKFPESIFYQPWTDTQEYAPIDRKLIRMLYLPQLRPGMSELDVRAILNSYR